MNGGKVLERLRLDDRTRDLRVFILGSVPGTKGVEIDVALARGALARLDKSKTTPAVLAQRIQEALPS